MRQWPEDIVRIANEVLAEIDDEHEYEYRLQSIMAAILAERQRCADAARRYLEDIAGCDMSDDEPDKISAAMLDPSWQPPPL